MAFQSNLKTTVDLPVFEWMRFSPTATAAASSTVSDINKFFVGGSPRYAYYNIATTFSRYDTVSDSWETLAVPTAETYVAAMSYNPVHGYYGRAIGPGTYTNPLGCDTMQLAGLDGQSLVGYKIYITNGTGAGQERNIIACTFPTVADQGPVTTYNVGPPANIQDSSTIGSLKNWMYNTWRDYQIRFTWGTGENQVRRILYNTNNSIYFYDPNHSVLSGYYSAPLATAVTGNATFYQIESSQITVDIPWTIAPDNTSRFVVKSGGIWYFTGAAAIPWYGLYYYDVLTDTWHPKSANQSLLFATINATDWAIETAGEEEGGATTYGSVATPLASNQGAISTNSNIAYNTARTLVDAGQASAIQTFTIANPGTGGTYAVGDVLTIATGTGGTVTITSVDGAQATNAVLTTAGTGYSATTYSTTNGGQGGGTGTGCTITVATLGMVPNQYRNMGIRLTSGAGAGQFRNIIGNNTNTFIIGRDWDVLPDSTTTYQVIGDSDRIYMTGGGYSGLYAYSFEADMLHGGRMFDYGVARTFTTQLLDSGGGIYTVSIVAGGSSYQVNDVLTLGTGTGGTVKVLAVSTGAVTQVSVTNEGTGYQSGVVYATTDTPTNGTGCTILVTSLVPAQVPLGITSITRTTGSMYTIAVNAAGTNYNVNDLLTVSGGTAGIIRVTTVGSGGTVTGVSIENPGTAGYTVTNGVATGLSSAKNGGASGCTINVTAITDIATGICPINHNFHIGDYVQIGGCDVTAPWYGGFRVITSVPSSTNFTYAIPYGCTMVCNITGNAIASISSYTTGGTNYTVQNMMCPTSSGAMTITAAGTGYNVGDILAVGWAAGGVGGAVKVSTVGSTGNVTAVTVASYGTGGYAASTTYATTNLGNSSTSIPYASQGTGCTITTGSVIGSVYNATATGGTNALIAVTTVTTGGVVTAASIIYGGTSYTNNSSATVTLVPLINSPLIFGGFALSTQTIVDTTKNWQPNEHAGKMVQVQLAGLAVTGNTGMQMRKIIQNTAQSIMVSGGQLFPQAPVNGTYRYGIIDPKPYGTEATLKNPTQFAWGIATGGSTTTLVDANKNWPVNYWAGKKVKLLAGTGCGNMPNEIPIASNTATTLTFGITGSTGTVATYTLRSVENAPDATTCYAIMDNWGYATGGGQFATAIGTGSPINYAVGDIVMVTGGSGFDNRYRVVSVTTGAPTQMMMLNAGAGYTAGSNLATQSLTGVGSALTLTTTNTAATSTTTITADWTMPVMGVAGTLIPSQSWGLNVATAKRVRVVADSNANCGLEYAITGTATSNTLSYASALTVTGYAQFAIMGVAPRTTGMSFTRLYGTSQIQKGQYIYSWRGGATPTIDKYDIVNDYWDYLTQFPLTLTYTTGSMFEYNGKDRIYFTSNATGQLFYYDLTKNIIACSGTVPFGMGAAIQGNRLFTMTTTDLWNNGIEYIYIQRHSGQEFWRVLTFW